MLEQKRKERRQLMKTVDDEVKEEIKLDVENIVQHLFAAYPNVKYICLNAGLTAYNQDTWKDEWYFAGFEKTPVYQMLDGFPAWVSDSTVSHYVDSTASFFLHISSKNHYYKDIPIQKNAYDFASPRFFCWTLENGKLTQYVSEEVDFAKAQEDFAQMKQNIKDFATEALFNRAKDLLEGRRK